jgi:ferritin-like metal-binding protein YciE
MLGYERQAKILEEILNEEKQADILLTELAESSINQRALV